MDLPVLGRRIGFVLLVLAIGAAAWVLLIGADSPEQGVLHLTAVCSTGDAEVGTRDTRALIFVAVNSSSGFLNGLTEGSFRVEGLSDELEIVGFYSGVAPGVYKLLVAPPEGDAWNWHEQNIAISVRGGGKGSGTIVVQMTLP